MRFWSDRPLGRLAVVDRNPTAAVDAPRYLVLVLARGHTSIALDAALGVAKEFHACHGSGSLRSLDTAQGCFGFLHLRDRVVAVGLRRVGRFAQHVGIGARRIFLAQILALEMPDRKSTRLNSSH